MSKVIYEYQEDYMGGKLYKTNKGVIAIVTVDAGMHHISISHRGRLPNYKEIKEARYQLCPNEIKMAQIYPPKEEFVNLHENCLHLWEI
ncbi:MAG: hypothetical protein U9O83_01135 [Campylobacterota bacterium]|nr:hypothetical protein [Campylobacterota bacterium]